MTSPDDLAKLRDKIDEIDGDLHALLKQRFEVTAAVSKAKGAASDPTLIPRPARERSIIERRLADHSGDLPARSLIRIWKEIMGAACHQQGDFKVGVVAEPFGALTLAVRDHFGTAVRLKFGSAETLSAELTDRRLALIVIGAEAEVPSGLHVTGAVEADGVKVGHLLSIHPAD